MPHSSKQINKQDVVFTQLENEGVILNLRTKYYFTVNETGMRVWELLEKGMTEPAIVEQLVEEYEIDQTTLKADVRELCQKFEREGLLI